MSEESEKKKIATCFDNKCRDLRYQKKSSDKVLDIWSQR